MSDFSKLDETRLSAAEKMAVERFCWEAREGLGKNLLSITLYGSAAREDYAPGRSDINILLLATSMEFAVLQALLDPVSRGLRVGIHPMLMTEADLRSSTDIFPVKFLSMKESHLTVWGDDPLVDLPIAREHIRLRCEQEMMNLALRLRRHYVYHGGWGLSEKVAGSVTGFLENLRFVLSLDKEKTLSREEALLVADKIGVPAAPLRKALSLKGAPAGREEIESIYEEYLKAVEKAVKMVDALGS